MYICNHVYIYICIYIYIFGQLKVNSFLANPKSLVAWRPTKRTKAVWRSDSPGQWSVHKEKPNHRLSTIFDWFWINYKQASKTWVILEDQEPPHLWVLFLGYQCVIFFVRSSILLNQKCRWQSNSYRSSDQKLSNYSHRKVLEIVEVNCFLRPIHGKPVPKEEGLVRSLNNIKQLRW
jgi:hypothetical protein